MALSTIYQGYFFALDKNDLNHKMSLARQETSLPSPRRGTNRVPGMARAYRLLAYVQHHVVLHLDNVLFEVLVVARVLRLLVLVVPDPDAHDGGRDGDGEEKVDPELVRYDRVGGFVRLPSQYGDAFFFFFFSCVSFFV